jgi:hypothetical protein
MLEELNNLTKDIREYIKVQFDLVKLHFAENISRILSRAANIAIILYLTSFILMFGSFSAAFFLSSMLDSNVLGFLCITGFYFLLLFIFLMIRKSLVEKPVIKAVINTIFPKNNNDKK